uniref:Uncharacterized protein n=1 Tax=Mycena chlorophos TaxID=658473 RepID=A0ABQ0LLA6_MYCCL|nr:predicted protein [Mycena chlorophos]
MTIEGFKVATGQSERVRPKLAAGGATGVSFSDQWPQERSSDKVVFTLSEGPSTWKAWPEISAFAMAILSVVTTSGFGACTVVSQNSPGSKAGTTAKAATSTVVIPTSSTTAKPSQSFANAVRGGSRPLPRHLRWRLRPIHRRRSSLPSSLRAPPSLPRPSRLLASPIYHRRHDHFFWQGFVDFEDYELRGLAEATMTRWQVYGHRQEWTEGLVVVVDQVLELLVFEQVFRRLVIQQIVRPLVQQRFLELVVRSRFFRRAVVKLLVVCERITTWARNPYPARPTPRLHPARRLPSLFPPLPTSPS